MKKESLKSTALRPSLDQRFADQPEVIDQLHALQDEVERALANGALAHEVERILQDRLRALGQRVLRGWAEQDLLSPASWPPPGATRHAKKNSSGKACLAPSKSSSKSGD